MDSWTKTYGRSKHAADEGLHVEVLDDDEAGAASESVRRWTTDGGGDDDDPSYAPGQPATGRSPNGGAPTNHPAPRRSGRAIGMAQSRLGSHEVMTGSDPTSTTARRR
jgi:hypothetical protein